MTMTYQQEFVLDGMAGRAAILNLDARHNRLFSAGDLGGWIATFRHAGATFTARERRSPICARPSTAATGSGWSPSTTRSPSTASTQPNTVSRCCSAKPNCAPPASTVTGSSTSVAAGTSRRASSNGTSCQARRATGVTDRHPLRVRVRHLRGCPAHGRHAHRTEVRGYRGERRSHPAFRVDGARLQPGVLGCRIRRAVWGGLVAPPALLMGWLIRRLGSRGRPPIPSIAIRVPLPGTDIHQRVQRSRVPDADHRG